MYVYRDTLLVQSPYQSDKQEIRYKLPSESYESISDISPKSFKDATLKYGPFMSTAAFAESEEVHIHFPSNAQFRTLEK